MNDLNFIKQLADKLEGVMALKINPHSNSGRATLDALADSELLLIVSPSSDIKPNGKEITNHRLSGVLNETQPVNNLPENNLLETNLEDALPQPKHSKTVGMADLTYREVQVLNLLTDGLSNKLIGRELNISHSTVKVHVKNILSKLKKHSRLEAALWAVENKQQEKVDQEKDCEKNI
jgi:ATP/maltotriose-dependent transcriptional regulator MalT